MQTNVYGRARIKICGITSVVDGLQAAQIGADAIGLVFYKASPRLVDTEQAAEIVRAVGAFTTTVGLFVNEDKDVIKQILAKVPLHLLQFHGDESAAFCEQFYRPYVKAIRMREGMDVGAAIQQHPNACGILLDAYRAGVPGGTGETFDWQRIPEEYASSVILAGGLNPQNINDAIAQVQPYAVDVSGGVETAPGKKDPEKVNAFIKNVQTMTGVKHCE